MCRAGISQGVMQGVPPCPPLLLLLGHPQGESHACTAVTGVTRPWDEAQRASGTSSVLQETLPRPQAPRPQSCFRQLPPCPPSFSSPSWLEYSSVANQPMAVEAPAAVPLQATTLTSLNACCLTGSLAPCGECGRPQPS